MTNFPRYLAGTALAAACLWTAPALAGPAAQVGLAPHKAIYNIKMTAKSSGSPVVNISGEMFFELNTGCDAWTTDHRFNLNYEYAESPAMKITSDFTTYESFDGKTLDFNSRRERNGEVFEEFRGRADIAAGKDGMAKYTLPDDLRYKLPAGAMFPMGHTAKLAEAARTGKKFFAATVFDGSDDQGPAEISAFIGKPASAPADLKGVKDVDQSLIARPGHNVRMAFFPLANSESDSEYEMSAIFHDNGVISDMTVEYKEFTVHQSLKALQPLSPEGCGAAQGKKDKKGKGPNTEKEAAPAPDSVP
jgi:hypothetical protein